MALGILIVKAASTMESSDPKHLLRQEHQSKALLLKLVWIVIAGWCFIFIATLSWDGMSTSAYVLAKVGVDLFLLADLGLIISTYLWLRSLDGMLQTSSKIERVTAILVVLWAIRAMYYWVTAASNGDHMPSIDLLAAIFAFTCLILARGATRARGNKAFVVAILACAVWFLACLALFLGVIVWLSQGGDTALRSSLPSSLLAALALLIAAMSLRVATRMRRALPGSPSSVELEYVATRLNLIAYLIFTCCVGFVFTSVLLFQGKPIRLTVVTSIIGAVAGLIAAKISMSPKFEDTLRVFSSSMGTQFVHPVQIMLSEEACEHIRTVELGLNGNLE
jgi:hypothetical protein